MNRIREIIQVMPLADIRQIVLDWRQFEQEGAIGECFLRTTARDYIGTMTTINITMAMRDFAFEAYRFIAHMYGAAVFREDFLVETDQ